MRTVIYLLVFFISISNGYSENNHYYKDKKRKSKVTRVKYKVLEKTYILPQQNLDVASLSMLDKANFKDKEYTNRYVLDLDSENNLRIKTIFVNHKNIFTEYYPHPYKTVEDSEGIKSYFHPSAYRSLDIKKEGDYYVSKKSKKLITESKRDDFYEEIYQERNRIAQNDGILEGLIFEMPAEETLENVEHSVNKKNGSITVTAENIRITWNPKRKTITEKYFEEGNLISTERKIYRYDKKHDRILLKKVIIKNFLKFSNGNDYEKLEIHSYEDYELSGEEDDQDDAEITVYPQPIQDYAIIGYPKLSEQATLKVYDTNGSLLLQRKLSADSREYQLNVSEYQSGMLFIVIETNSKTYSKKLIKL